MASFILPCDEVKQTENTDEELRRAFADVFPPSNDHLQQLSDLSTDDFLNGTLEEINANLKPHLSHATYQQLCTAIVRRRVALIFSSGKTKHCVVITAPHTIKLCRDNHPPHATELFTRRIAERFSEEVGGCCITWSEGEQRRVSSIVKSGQHPPPPSNRDPNYLTNEELDSSVWFHYLKAAKHSLLLATNHCRRLSLHLDVHGMRDSSIDGFDVVFGTEAMLKNGKDVDLVMAFRKLLLEKITPVLASMSAKSNTNSGSGSTVSSRNKTKTKTKEKVTATTTDEHVFAASVDHERLNGWAGKTRNTLTQMSTNKQLFQNQEFGLSLQIELSHRIRKVMEDNRWNHCARFVRAIEEAANLTHL